MVTTIAIALAALFLGYAAHQRQTLTELQFRNSELQQTELDHTATIASLQCEVKAHEASLTMIMDEVVRDDDTSA